MIAPALAAALAVAALPPLVCPAGAERKGGGPPDLFEEWCEGKDDGGRPRREGPARAWYDDGGLHVEESFRAGLREGRFVERHRNGSVAREGTYAAGLKVGVWRIASERGAPEEESEWSDGLPHGRFRAWWPGGPVRAEGQYCRGVQCGRWRSYGASGRLEGEVEYGEQRAAP